MEEKTFIEHFLALAAIPHPSFHEERIGQHLLQWATDLGLEARRDDAGNVIVDKAAAPDYEGAPLTILQAHMDMVAVGRPGSGFDPLSDAVAVVNDGKTLRAERSSLGGDDGAGVALIQTLLEEDLPCGPLRAIFTVNEEQGMSGANALEAEELSGKYLLNLDWETSGALCCACAGSEHYRFAFDPSWEAAAGAAYTLRVSGLPGGHSGTMIHTRRMNALWAVAELLRRARAAGLDPRLAALQGGTAPNAIPAAAEALVVVPAERAAALERLVKSAAQELLQRFGELEKGAEIGLAPAPMPQRVLSAVDTVRLLDTMCGLDTGVHTLSADCPGLVESSANLGRAEASGDGVWCEVLQRSSVPAITAAMRRQYVLLAARNGAVLRPVSASPAWPPRSDSRLTRLCREVYRDVAGGEIAVESVHAGLECGVWAEKNPALDMISIGPEVRDIHSPEETLELESVALLHALVRGILREIAKE